MIATWFGVLGELLERIPTGTWKEQLLSSDNQRLVIQGGLALMVAEPTPEHGRLVIDAVSRVLKGFVEHTKSQRSLASDSSGFAPNGSAASRPGGVYGSVGKRISDW